MKKILMIVGVVLVVILLFSACQAGPQVRVIELVAYQWDWTPETITVKQGEEVRLVIMSTAEVDQSFPFHGFVLEGYNINRILPVGETAVVEFVADKAGEFSFICSIFCGDGHEGMIGTLKVE